MAVQKKAAAKKPAAKKPAAKKAPAKKAALAKKAAPAKTTTTEISVTGNKKVGTLCNEFNKKFPYICLVISEISSLDDIKSGKRIHRIDPNKTLASVRVVKSGGDISIRGNKKIKSLEEEFKKAFGLCAQVGYRTAEGKNYYTMGADEKTLASFNDECEAKGCQKGGWK